MNRDALGETRLCVKLSLGNATTACRGACWAMRFATSPAARHGNGRLLKCVDVGARAASRPDRTPTVYTRSLFSVSLLDRSSQSIFYTGSLCLNSASTRPRFDSACRTQRATYLWTAKTLAERDDRRVKQVAPEYVTRKRSCTPSRTPYTTLDLLGLVARDRTRTNGDVFFEVERRPKR